MGYWELLAEDSEVPAVHAALLPNGEVLYYSGNTGPTLPAEARIWDPIGRSVRTPPNAPDVDLFCSGLSFMFVGQLLVVGGTAKYSDGPGDPWFGSKSAFLFQPGGGWVRIPDMAFGRWYPSAVCLADGRVLVASGEGDDGGRTTAIEIYDPFSGWQTLAESANRFLPLYPRLHVLPNGEVACAGQGAATAVLNLETQEWREIAPAALVPGAPEGIAASQPVVPPRPGRRRPRRRRPEPHEHGEDSVGPRPDDLAVLLAPAQAGKVLNAGGGDPALNAAFIIDFNEAEPVWREVAAMHHARWFPNSAIMPDGRLFVCGGGRVRNADPVMEPEIFDPASETWSLDEPMTVPRLYHSTAMLLPDGRIWVAGTDLETRMELYTPDYLLGGERPLLYAAPASVTYSQTFPIPMPNPGDVADVCFIRLSTVTHAWNVGQRHIPLDFFVSADEELTIIAPADWGLAPQGHYMLFIRNTAGVPAVAPIVQLLIT
jgi:hypothetical protein